MFRRGPPAGFPPPPSGFAPGMPPFPPGAKLPPPPGFPPGMMMQPPGFPPPQPPGFMSGNGIMPQVRGLQLPMKKKPIPPPNYDASGKWGRVKPWTKKNNNNNDPDATEVEKVMSAIDRRVMGVSEIVEKQEQIAPMLDVIKKDIIQYYKYALQREFGDYANNVLVPKPQQPPKE